MQYSLIAGLLVILSSILGSFIGIIFKKISHRTNDIFLGFAAGIMLCAVFTGLLPTALSGNSFILILIGVLGVIIGATFISLLDKFIPHVHFENENMDNKSIKKSSNRTLLLIFAIAIHNIPEGLATGIVFGNGINPNAIMVAISMIIQKLPEGLIVIIPLLSMGMKKNKAFLLSILVAFMMLPGIIIGAILGSLPLALGIFFYAFTFGAIIYVVSDEIIPESHEHGFQKEATFALIVGVLIVCLLQFI